MVVHHCYSNPHILRPARHPHQPGVSPVAIQRCWQHANQCEANHATVQQLLSGASHCASRARLLQLVSAARALLYAQHSPLAVCRFEWSVFGDDTGMFFIDVSGQH